MAPYTVPSRKCVRRPPRRRRQLFTSPPLPTIYGRLVRDQPRNGPTRSQAVRTAPRSLPPHKSVPRFRFRDNTCWNRRRHHFFRPVAFEFAFDSAGELALASGSRPRLPSVLVLGWSGGFPETLRRLRRRIRPALSAGRSGADYGEPVHSFRGRGTDCCQHLACSRARDRLSSGGGIPWRRPHRDEHLRHRRDRGRGGTA